VKEGKGKGAAGEGEEGSGRRGERKGGPAQGEERGASWRGRGDRESRVWFGSFYIMSSSNPDCRIVRSMATVRWEKVGREGEIGPRKRSGPVVVCRAPRFRPTVNIIFFQNCCIWILVVNIANKHKIEPNFNMESFEFFRSQQIS
jgi:hypothetical protein